MSNTDLIAKIFDQIREKALERFSKQEAAWKEIIENNLELDITNIESDLIEMYNRYIDSDFVNEHSLVRIGCIDSWEWLPEPEEYIEFLKENKEIVKWKHSKKFAAQNKSEIQISCELDI